MLEVWERNIQKQEEALSKHYVDQAFLNNKVLIDLRKTRIPDAQKEVGVDGPTTISKQPLYDALVDPKSP